MKRFTYLFLFIFCFCGCAQLGYIKDPFVDIPNFYQVDQRIWRGGQPNQAGFEQLKARGIKTVLSLRGQGEQTEEEKALLESLGMHFYNLPMSVYQRPDDQLILDFLKLVMTKENQPVFIHCVSGRDRTGALIAVYRVLIYDWQPKQAYNEAKKYGFWPYRGEAQLQRLILQIKDKPEWYAYAKKLRDEENN